MLIGSYWGERAESRTGLAMRILRFLEAIGAVRDSYSTWHETAHTKREALRKRVLFELADLEGRLTPCRFPGESGPPRLGYSLSLWNQRGCTLRFSVGVTSPRLKNAVVLHDKQMPDLEVVTAKVLLEAAVRAFEPDEGCAVTESMQGEAESPILERGWLRYQREAGFWEPAKPRGA